MIVYQITNVIINNLTPVMHIIPSSQKILANIREALDVLNLSANSCGENHNDRNDQIRSASSECVPGMPPCKKMFTAQRPVMANPGRCPPMCVSDTDMVCQW